MSTYQPFNTTNIQNFNGNNYTTKIELQTVQVSKVIKQS